MWFVWEGGLVCVSFWTWEFATNAGGCGWRERGSRRAESVDMVRGKQTRALVWGKSVVWFVRKWWHHHHHTHHHHHRRHHYHHHFCHHTHLHHHHTLTLITTTTPQVDGRVRTDTNFPAGFMDVVSIPKSNDTFRLLFDTKGRFVLNRIDEKESGFKLCRVKKQNYSAKGVPTIATYDGRTIRCSDPLIKVNDTVKVTSPTFPFSLFFDTTMISLPILNRPISDAPQTKHR